jgi:hypothetical protein
VFFSMAINSNTPSEIPGQIRAEKGTESGKGDRVCAKKLGEGGSDVRSISETFLWNPAGKQSRLVERGPQPEASLAWGGVSRTAKRRQRVLMPCD